MVKPVNRKTWAMTNMDVKRLSVRERIILRKIQGPMVQQGISRIRTEHTLREL
jgi:hypothetical protein